ncbi:AraC family transcriptional regulator [Streptomyces violaceusniger]|uniref:Transcriptional regulator, AraC family n=1 Tax=Streptomyces violaceusniger (strain Tu 4113) TaxID=653045 RepID=G2PF95_STRV4|nr:AraC family transcriptional regulator [Streptomyces violaceusniger]AEM84238.1 transcriptional regulator, AraC family [Streptomyces violaceusniger Tu 4113]
MSAAPLLANHAVLHTEDVAATEEWLTPVLGRHELSVAATTRPDIRFHSYQLGSLRLSYLSLGASARFELAGARSGYLVLVPLTGNIWLCGTQQMRIAPGLGTVLGPSEPVSARCSADCGQLIVELNQAVLTAHVHSLLHNSSAESPVFEPLMRFDSGSAMSWYESLMFLAERANEADSSGEPIHPLVATELERALMTELLVTQPNTYSPALVRDQPSQPVSPVERAVRLINEYPEVGHTAADLAQAAGVSVRTLEKAFRRRFGLPPCGYLRQVRLKRVRAELTATGAAKKTVSEVAARWGFSHFGRFAQEYRKKYHENPSETVRRHRAMPRLEAQSFNSEEAPSPGAAIPPGR